MVEPRLPNSWNLVFAMHRLAFSQSTSDLTSDLTSGLTSDLTSGLTSGLRALIELNPNAAAAQPSRVNSRSGLRQPC